MQDLSQQEDGEGGAMGVNGKAEKPAALRIPSRLELGYVLADGHIEVPALIDPWTRQPLTKSMCEAVMELHKEARRHHFAQRSVAARIARMEAEKVPEHATVHQYPKEALDVAAPKLDAITIGEKLASQLSPGDHIIRHLTAWRVLKVVVDHNAPIGMGGGSVFVVCQRRDQETDELRLPIAERMTTIEVQP